MCTIVLPAHMYVYYMYVNCMFATATSDPLELQLQMAEWVLGTKPRLSGRAASVPNHKNHLSSHLFI